MNTALDKWPGYYLSIVTVTLSDPPPESDQYWIGVLINNIVLSHQVGYFESVRDGMKILWEAFFSQYGVPTFSPEQLHPHFVDLLPDIKTWLDTNPTESDVGMGLLVADLEERSKLDEVFAWKTRN
jgi:hypothetical protein